MKNDWCHGEKARGRKDDICSLLNSVKLTKDQGFQSKWFVGSSQYQEVWSVLYKCGMDPFLMFGDEAIFPLCAVV